MTEREKEIEKAAQEYGKEYINPGNTHGFIKGAKWADENPKDPNDIIIDLIHQRSIAFDQVREEMDKNEKLRQKLAIYKTLLRDAREQMALMADGEGRDYRVYMEMSLYGVNQIDKGLAQISEVENG